MSETDKSTQQSESATTQLNEELEIKATEDGAASVAEVERLVGTARAGAGEIERLLQAVSKSAADAELATTKAEQHSSEIEEKRKSADTDTATIKSLAEACAKSSEHIDDGVKYTDTSRATIDETIKAAAELKSQIDAHANKVAEDSAALKSLLSELVKKRDEIAPLSQELTELQTKAVDAKTVAEEAQDETTSLRDTTKVNAEEAATRCKDIEDGKVYIDAERAKIEQYTSEASTKATETDNAATAAQNSLTSIKEIRENADTALAEIKQAAAETQTTKNEAEADRVATAELAKIADSVQERVNEYEAELERLNGEFGTVHTKIETLLPDAASAGLAWAFHKQKGEYARPRSLWTGLLLLALAGLAAISGMEIYSIWESLGAGNEKPPIPEYNELLRSFVTRLPFIAALVWLALHAGNKARIANQIKEDYEFKEVVSRAFEGYKKEFASLDQQLDPESPLGKLCTSMVSVIAAPPGRVYEKQSSDPTPMSSAAEVAKQLAPLKKAIKGSIDPLE